MAGRERRVEPLEADHAARRHAVQAPLEDPVLDRAQALAQDLDEADRLVLGVGHRPDRRDRVEDALDRARLEADHADLGVDPADGLADLAVADRADVAQLLGQDEVGWAAASASSSRR